MPSPFLLHLPAETSLELRAAVGAMLALDLAADELEHGNHLLANSYTVSNDAVLDADREAFEAAFSAWLRRMCPSVAEPDLDDVISRLKAKAAENETRRPILDAAE